MVTRKVAPALAAGCTVVIKAPPETPFSTLAFVELAIRAGIPKGVINVVTTQSHTKEVGLEITTNPTIKKISFTGSVSLGTRQTCDDNGARLIVSDILQTGVGRLLMQQSASTIKKTSMELGGLAPFVGELSLHSHSLISATSKLISIPFFTVFGDADIDAAVNGAVAAKFRASGQTCVCSQFHLVHSSIYEEFATKLAAKVNAFKVGNGFDDVTHGPLIHEAAVAKVEKHVADAVARGAKVLAGGKRPNVKGGEKGSFFEPTREFRRESRRRLC